MGLIETVNANFKRVQSEDETIRWKVSINGQEFNYFEGLGHVFNTNHRLYNKIFFEDFKKAILNCEPLPRVSNNGRTLTLKELSEVLTDRVDISKGIFHAPLIHAPNIKYVLYCLSIDAEALDFNFEDWCGTFGYDSDSIKAKNIYDDCIENGLKLKRAGLDIDSLQKYFEDY